MSEIRSTANVGYALGRLERALATLREHPDEEVRARAAVKIEKWRRVIDGMQSASLTVGSRTPVKDVPSWVTLEVVHGGFASGGLLAERPLDDEEQALLQRIEVRGETERERLNLFFAGDAGQQILVEAACEGRYRIDVPEDGALMMIALLLERGLGDLALELLAVLRPWMHRLRFHPRLEAVPRPAGSTVRVASVEEVAGPLSRAKVNPRVARMIEALRVWNPLYDRLVGLWLETVDGEAPVLSAEGAVDGGWPCRRFPENWSERRAAWLTEYRAAAATARCDKHRHPKSNFARLRGALEACEQDSRKLSGRDVGWIRRCLANTLRARGAPSSDSRRALREAQASIASRPTHSQLAKIVARRLRAYPAEGGLPSLDSIGAPVTEVESREVPAGCPIPEHLLRKAERALEAPIQELIERGVIASAEVLAIVLPQITAQVAAAGIEDSLLCDLYQRTYAAFRKRRSLLLLDLEHQVRFDELPWISALSTLRASDLGAQMLARRTLEEVALLATTAFPETILPNPLVKEMNAVAERADLDLPLTEELASDIFMGTFTKKWLRAAQIASELLEGTLYARYYDLPPLGAYEDQPGGLLSRLMTVWSKETADGFAELCSKRAQEATSGAGSWVAQNGAVIEQSQILTTHNLAPLIVALELSPRLGASSLDLAERIFEWIVSRQTQSIGTFRAHLKLMKNSAYAWRQAIFFLSLADEAAQRAALAALESRVERAQNPAWAARFSPAVAGLRRVLDGGRFDEQGLADGDPSARRFLGWSVGPHWMLPASDA